MATADFTTAFHFPGATITQPKPVTPVGSQQPIIGANGLIIGYSGANGQPLTSSGGRTPMYGPTGLIVGYMGADGKPIGTTVTATNHPDMQPTDPNADFSLLHQTKSQPIADATAGLLGDVKANQETVSKTFNDYLNEFKDQNAQQQDALKADRATLTDTGTLTKALTGADAGYQAAGSASLDALRQANAAFKAENDSLRQQQQAQLPIAQDLAQAEARRAVAGAYNRINLGAAGGGTPGTASSQYANDLTGADLSVMTPLLADQARQRMDLINQGFGLNSQYLANDTNAIQFGQGLAREYASNGRLTANTIQQLRLSLAGKSMQESQQYLDFYARQIGIPTQILAGQIGLTSSLANLDQANNFYGLAQNYTAPVVNYPNYQQPASSFPTPNNLYPNVPAGSNVTGSVGPARAPVTPAYRTVGTDVYDASGNWVGPASAFQTPSPTQSATLDRVFGNGFSTTDEYGNIFDRGMNMNGSPM